MPTQKASSASSVVPDSQLEVHAIQGRTNADGTPASVATPASHHAVPIRNSNIPNHVSTPAIPHSIAASRSIAGQAQYDTLLPSSQAQQQSNLFADVTPQYPTSFQPSAPKDDAHLVPKSKDPSVVNEGVSPILQSQSGGLLSQKLASDVPRADEKRHLHRSLHAGITESQVLAVHHLNKPSALAANTPVMTTNRPRHIPSLQSLRETAPTVSQPHIAANTPTAVSLKVPEVTNVNVPRITVIDATSHNTAGGEVSSAVKTADPVLVHVCLSMLVVTSC